MKCICGSGANEEIKRLRDLGQDIRVDNFAAPQLREKIKDLTADCQITHDRNSELQKRVTVLKGLWGVSIKNNTGLKAQITWLENVLREVCELASRNFSPSSRPSRQAKSPGDRE